MDLKATLEETTAWIKIIRLQPSVPLSAIHTTSNKVKRQLCKQPHGKFILRLPFSASLVILIIYFSAIQFIYGLLSHQYIFYC